ncbi:NUDIX hydrolase [Enterococcus sp. HY326]|uniref:NUDIX hydrolase n=1 Tax=Enterococcus sp. HY326 TaxID=2971265 RepID=UPI002ACD796B|nr:NUDIX domain-containing protein [Enterococcus sp. HY326]
MKVTIYNLNEKADNQLAFAVIIAKFEAKYLFVQHKNRSTLEIPGGHREAHESILTCAQRELYEETGALDYSIDPLFVYGVQKDNQEEDFGLVFFAEILELEPQLHFEISKLHYLDSAPKNWTYPQIQPKLFTQYLTKHDKNHRLGDC